MQVGHHPKLWRKEIRWTQTERKRRGEENTKWYYQQVELNPKIHKIWKLYMNPYSHGVRNNRKAYILHTGREFMSTRTLKSAAVFTEVESLQD